MKRFVLAWLVSVAAPPAAAWESECRTGLARVETFDAAVKAIEASICGPLPLCAEGFDAARGTLYGEHTWITMAAMKLVGLGDFATMRAVPRFYSHAEPPTSELPGVAQTPALAGAMERIVDLQVTIAELSQVPDVSFGLADYLAGNEHCFVAHTPRGTVSDIQKCHAYTTHLGPVNSTHFVPQSQHVYGLYHGLALQVAARCKTLGERFAASQHPLRDWVRDTVLPSCEREALALEATGSHFIEDAWSSGHMWQRWGSPILSPDQVGQTRDMVVGGLSGVIHGWRSFASGTLGLKGKPEEHDRLCLGGPFPGVDDEAVEWTIAGDLFRDYHPGIGDDYLLACKTIQKSDEHTMRAGPSYAVARRRMLSCTGRGFYDVYQAGPMTRGPRALPRGSDFEPDALPQSEKCWGQRVSNQSMQLALGISAQPDTRTGSFGADIEYLLASAPIVEAVIGREARAALQPIIFRVRWRAAADPTGTDLADLEGDVMATLLGARRNSEGVELITGDAVTYLERSRLDHWRGERTRGATCTRDDQCADDAYCAAGIAHEDTGRRCAPKEAAIMSAYRAAHVADWCRDDTPATVLSAIAHCGESGVATSNACEACVEVVMPHLRNGCSASVWAASVPDLHDPTKMQDRRSICDAALGADDPAPVYGAYDPATPNDARRAARDACCRPGPDGRCRYQADVSFTEGYGTTLAFPTSLVYFDNSESQHEVTGNLCGAGVSKARDHAYSLLHEMPNTRPHAHRFRLEPRDLVTPDGVTRRADADKLLLLVYEQDCRTLIGQGTRTAAPDNAREWLWKPSWAVGDKRVCVRVTAADPSAWTGYTLTIDDVDPREAFPGTPACALGARCTSCGPDDFVCDVAPPGCGVFFEPAGTTTACCPSDYGCCAGLFACPAAGGCGTCCQCRETESGEYVPDTAPCCGPSVDQCADNGCGPCKPTFSCCECVDGNKIYSTCCGERVECPSPCP